LKKTFIVFHLFFNMMYPYYIQAQPNNGTAYAGQLSNVLVGNSFRAPNQFSPSERRNKIDDDLGSTTSESSSAVSSATPTAMSESAMEDESQSVRSDASMGTGYRYDIQKPQVVPVPQSYEQVRCSRQQYRNLYPSNVGAAIPGIVNMLPYQVQQVPINYSQVSPVQFNHVVNPVVLQQRHAGNLPVSTSTVSTVGAAMSYSPTIVTTSSSQQASSNSFSNAVGTCPSLGYYNMPGYVNSYFVNSSMASPQHYAVQSSAIPQLSHLNYNLQYNNLPYRTIPNQVSCGINSVPVPSVIPTNEIVSTPECNRMKESTPSEKEAENIWIGNCSYEVYNVNGGSNLFISWKGTKFELLQKLKCFELEIRSASRTTDKGIFNVVFDNHSSARKAFLKQRELRLRMVPPRGSYRNWFRNPSPTNLVKFETRCRLVVKKGKAQRNDIVGHLLMSDSEEQKGCIIWADQLKNHRIRIVSCEGSFMFAGGKVVEMKGILTNTDRQKSLGWTSYRNKYTRESYVTRISGTNLGDYIYTE